MNQQENQQLHELLERAFDARGDADDSALKAWIAARPADERAEWELLAAEVGLAREAVGDVPTPPGLENQLLQIAAAPPPWHWRDLLQYQLKNWQIALALAAIALVVGISIWPTEPARPPVLDDHTMQVVTTAATAQQAKPLTLVSSDSAAVLAMLKGQHLPFEPKLPNVQSAVVLDGVSITAFGNATAVQTKWHGPNGAMTLYQFDAKAMNLPQVFSTMLASVGTPPQAVTIWPGRKQGYAWALVGAEECENPFFEACPNE